MKKLILAVAVCSIVLLATDNAQAFQPRYYGGGFYNAGWNNNSYTPGVVGVNYATPVGNNGVISVGYAQPVGGWGYNSGYTQFSAGNYNYNSSWASPAFNNYPTYAYPTFANPVYPTYNYGYNGYRMIVR